MCVYTDIFNSRFNNKWLENVKEMDDSFKTSCILNVSVFRDVKDLAHGIFAWIRYAKTIELWWSEARLIRGLLHTASAVRLIPSYAPREVFIQLYHSADNEFVDKSIRLRLFQFIYAVSEQLNSRNTNKKRETSYFYSLVFLLKKRTVTDVSLVNITSVYTGGKR